MKKILILLLIVFSSASLAQEARKTEDLKCKVFGLVLNGNSYYLYTENGLVKINNWEDDPWEKYYQEIYNDSTIVSPNTIIDYESNSSSINFFNPAIDISQWSDKYNTFGNKLYLYDFMQIDEDGNYTFKPGIVGLIQKELGNEKKKR